MQGQSRKKVWGNSGIDKMQRTSVCMQRKVGTSSKRAIANAEQAS